MQLYKNLDILPEDPILGIAPLYKADTNRNKINLGIGAYQDEKGKPVVFEAVRQAEELLIEQRLDKEYLPIIGDAAYIEATLKLVFGEAIPSLQEGRLVAAQTVGDSGALRITSELLKECGIDTIYFSSPTWPNHYGLFKHGHLQTAEYPYYDDKVKTVNFDKLCQAIEKIPPHSAIMFQGSCHNPTGARLSEQQWHTLSALLKTHKIQPVFDLAYQGLGRGLEEDAFAVRLFAKEHTPIVCVSFSKNFGLYGERVGLFAAILPEKGLHSAVLSHVKHLIRGNYSMPPLHGARIIKTILTNPSLKAVWNHQLTEMRQRLQSLRQMLVDALSAENPKGNYSFYTQGEGFFSMTGLKSSQILWLRQAKSLYMPENGRINIAGLNRTNIPLVAEALLEAEKQ